MKTISKWAVVVAAMLVMVSCSKDEPQEGGGTTGKEVKITTETSYSDVDHLVVVAVNGEQPSVLSVGTWSGKEGHISLPTPKASDLMDDYFSESSTDPDAKICLVVIVAIKGSDLMQTQKAYSVVATDGVWKGFYAYVDRDVTMKGARGDGGNWDLTLKKGWNMVWQKIESDGTEYYSSTAPANWKWKFAI